MKSDGDIMPNSPATKKCQRVMTAETVFISLHFGEAMTEAFALRDALRQRGHDCCIHNVAAGTYDEHGLVVLQTFIQAQTGENIGKTVTEGLYLHNCKMAIIMGTSTYGAQESSNSSTRDELECVETVFIIFALNGSFAVGLYLQ